MLVTVDPRDNVAVCLDALAAGERVGDLIARGPIPAGHKIALTPISAGAPVRKYGFEIGRARRSIQAGEHVHLHNLESQLADEVSPVDPAEHAAAPAAPFRFMGFRRPDGRVAIRNEIWIVTTVGCVNAAATQIANIAHRDLPPDSSIEGVYAFVHPFGCSQLGDDLDNTRQVLARLVDHPHAAGVLVIGLGCENNQLRRLLEAAGAADSPRVRAFDAQDVDDEVDHGLALVQELIDAAGTARREAIEGHELVIGLKCGGSDGFSGITANPLVGHVADRHCASGGTALLTEIPEMFGAEALVARRAQTPEISQAVLTLARRFRAYYRDHGEPIDENPSPGNHDGGLTTLAEKSLGCVQKGGRAPVAEVVDYARAASPGLSGLSIVAAPGNDAVSTTALVAAGAHLVLFTTGRGTPLGSPVPTLKIATRSTLASAKKRWIDFDAGPMTERGAVGRTVDDLVALITQVASGQPTASERNHCRDIAIWKTGVVL